MYLAVVKFLISSIMFTRNQRIKNPLNNVHQGTSCDVINIQHNGSKTLLNTPFPC